MAGSSRGNLTAALSGACLARIAPQLAAAARPGARSRPGDPRPTGCSGIASRHDVGDGGRLYFWMREADLVARAFENTWMILQCC